MRFSKFFALVTAYTALQMGMIYNQANAWNCDLTCKPDCYVDNIYLDVIGGYREDELSSHVAEFSCPTGFVGTDHLKVKRINVYEVGGIARAEYCNFYTRAYGTYGWGHHGKYEETSENFGCCENRTTSSVFRTRTKDLTVGIGYSLPLYDYWCNPWNVGLIGGWYYDEVHLTMSNAYENGFFSPIVSGFRYKNRWSGPWVGLDISFECGNGIFNGGYEYHWGHWNGDWLLRGPDVRGVAFSDHRESHHVCGSVIFADAKWKYWFFEIGLGIRLQEFKANNGHLKPLAGSFAAVGLPRDEIEKLKHARWYSAGVHLDLGITF
jgi:hypothetical protein